MRGRSDAQLVAQHIRVGLSNGAKTSRSMRSASRASSVIQVHIVTRAFGNRAGSLSWAASASDRESFAAEKPSGVVL